MDDGQRTDKRLPCARRADVVGEGVIGLEPELAGEWRLNFAWM